MWTLPVTPPGTVATSWLADTAMKLAAVVPNTTWVAPLRLAPLMVTWLTPAVGPVVGLTLDAAMA